MKYTGDVPESEQIPLHQFKLLPGSQVIVKVNNVFYQGCVREVGACAAEYMMWLRNGKKGRKPKITYSVWKESKRENAEAFFDPRGLVSNYPIKFKESVWAVIQYSLPPDNALGFPAEPGTKELKFYTYDIEKMLKEDHLRIINK